jgi:peptidoglycan hydrolase-like protein with peptidoglycan-binding domain
MKKELIAAALVTSCTFTGVAIASAKFDKDIRFGMKGQEVKDLQGFLTKRKFFNAEATGLFGPKTRDALKKYQKSKGLDGSGTIVGSSTRKHLNDDEHRELGDKDDRRGGEREDDDDNEDRDEDRGGRSTSTTPVIIKTPTTSTSTSGAAVKTVTTKVNFNTPGGVNSLTLNVSGSAGVITDFTYSVQANDGTSKGYANSFSKSLSKSSIVGKSISNVSLSRVGGASLTTGAFMNALKSVNGTI